MMRYEQGYLIEYAKHDPFSIILIAVCIVALFFLIGRSRND